MPRPETENLVQIACDWVKKIKLEKFSYLDLCTGSGNIFLSILEKFKDQLTRSAAVDCSILACNNTLTNIKNYDLQDISEVYLSNWEKFLEERNTWDVITINPPYVSEEEFKEMNKKGLSKYDPKWALQAGDNGWSHYSKVIDFAFKNTFWKLIVLEVSEFHEHLWDKVNQQIKSFQVYKYRDYLNKFRVVVLSRN